VHVVALAGRLGELGHIGDLCPGGPVCGDLDLGLLDAVPQHLLHGLVGVPDPHLVELADPVEVILDPGGLWAGLAADPHGGDFDRVLVRGGIQADVADRVGRFHLIAHGTGGRGRRRRDRIGVGLDGEAPRGALEHGRGRGRCIDLIDPPIVGLAVREQACRVVGVRILARADQHVAGVGHSGRVHVRRHGAEVDIVLGHTVRRLPTEDLIHGHVIRAAGWDRGGGRLAPGLDRGTLHTEVVPGYVSGVGAVHALGQSDLQGQSVHVVPRDRAVVASYGRPRHPIRAPAEREDIAHTLDLEVRGAVEPVVRRALFLLSPIVDVPTEVAAPGREVVHADRVLTRARIVQIGDPGHQEGIRVRGPAAGAARHPGKVGDPDRGDEIPCHELVHERPPWIERALPEAVGGFHVQRTRPVL